MTTIRTCSSTACLAIVLLAFGTATSSQAAPANLVSAVDARAQLQILETKGPLGNEAIPLLETLLSSETDLAGLMAQREHGLRDIEGASQKAYEAAYRLMRLYEKNGQRAQVQTLALRIARGDKPFEVRDSARFAYLSSNDVPEFANAALAVAIQLASDKQQQEALAKALQNSLWVGARAQIERRLGGEKSVAVGPAFGWANLPKGVKLLASNQNVLSLCHDKYRIYAGHPWGVAIYDLNGKAVTRVALSEPAITMAICNGALWVGTPDGLMRVDLATFALSLLRGNQDLLDFQRREEKSMHEFYNGVEAVASRGDVLWIGTRRDVRQFNTRTGALRIFSSEELGGRSEWSRFLFDGRFVWVDSNDEGCRRYDPKSGLWKVPESPNKRHPITLIGIAGGQLWGNVWVNDELRYRVALINRDTLKVTSIPIEGGMANQTVNEPFVLSGTFRGHPAFGGYFFDSASGRLKPIPTAKDEQQFFVVRGIAVEGETGATWLNPAGDLGEAGSFVSMAILPNGNRIVGTRSNRTRYQYPHEDWPFDTFPRETKDGAGGLKLVSPKGTRSLSEAPRADCLTGDEVFFALEEKSRNRVWLGTQKGLRVLDSSANFQRNWTRRDGLISDRVVSGGFSSGKLFFGTGWGDSGGGLGIYDPAISVFSARLSHDGLSTDKLTDVRVQNGRLQVSYGVEYRRSGDNKYQQYRPNFYDIAKDTFTPTMEPVVITQPKADEVAAKAASEAILGSPAQPTKSAFPVHSKMPFLGGFVISSARIGNRTWVCGTRGVVVLQGQNVAAPVKEIVAHVSGDSPSVQIADALRRAKPIRTTSELAKSLADANPFARAEALGSLYDHDLKIDPFLSLIIKATTDPAVRVRSTATFLLLQSKNDALIVPVLQKQLNDANFDLRGLATVELLKRKHVPPTERLIEVLKGCQQNAYGNSLFGAASTTGLQVDIETFLPLVAPHATPAIFVVLMQDPPHSGDYDFATSVFPALGAALRKHPESVAVLLLATDKTGIWEQPRFVHDVFGFADKTVLPVLHDALQSSNPLVRANAARACARIGDASSIEPLIRALELKSGVSRIPIVETLGTLKAEAAIPVLATLYVEAIAKSPFSSWDPSARAGQLQATHIRAAVRAMGPNAEPLFARALSARRGGAVLLPQNGEDMPLNFSVLEGLWLDEDEGVRMSAAVSLLRWGKDAPQSAVLQWLQSNDEGMKNRVLEELQRLRPEQLSFARAIIQSLADNAKSSELTKELARTLLKPSHLRTGYGF